MVLLPDNYKSNSNSESVFTGNVDPYVHDRANSIGELLAYSVPGTIAAFADTVGQSVGIFDDNDTKTALTNIYKDFGDFYSRNEDGLKIAGDLTGMFLPGIGAMALIRGGGAFAKALNYSEKAGGFKNKLLSSVFTSGKNHSTLLHTVRAREKLLARAGVNPLADRVRNEAVKQVYKTRTFDTIKETVAFEAGVYATMNESQVLYPDNLDTVDLIMLNAAFPAGALGIESLVLRQIMRGGLQKAQKGVAAAQNPLNLTVDALSQSRPGERDVAATANALQADAAKKMQAQPPEGLSKDVEALSRDQASKSETVAKQRVKAEAERMASDDPFSGPYKVGKDDRFTGRHSLSTSEYNTIAEATEQNPYVLYGVKSIDELPDSTEGLTHIRNNKRNAAEMKRNEIDAIELQIKNRKKGGTEPRESQQAKMDQLRKEAYDLDGHTHFVLSADGEVIPAAEYKIQWQDVAQRTQDGKKFKFDRGISPDGETSAISLKVTTPGTSKTSTLTVDENLIMYGLPKAPSDFEMQAAYKLYDEVITRLSTKYSKLDDIAKNNTIAVNPDSHFMQLDALVSLVERNKGAEQLLSIPANRLTQGMSVVENLQLMSLKQKYKVFGEELTLIDKANKAGGFAAAAANKRTLQDVARKLNLPTSADNSLHPVLELFSAMHRAEKTPEFPFKNLDDFRKSLQSVLTFPEVIAKDMSAKLAIKGNQISNTAYKKSVVMLQKPNVEPSILTAVNLNYQAAMLKTATRETLEHSKDEGALFNNFVMNLFRQNEDAVRAARDVRGLSEGMLRGLNTVTTAAFRHADNLSLRAADSLVSLIDKRARTYVGDLFKQHEQAFNTLRKPGNQLDMHSFNLGYHGAQIWELGDAVRIGENKWAFEFKNNTYNQQKFKELGFESTEELKYVPMMSEVNPATGKRGYQPLVLTDNAYAALEAVSSLSQTLGKNMRVLQKAAGRGNMNIRPWHVPPSNFLGKDIRYAIENDDVVAAFADVTEDGVKRQAEAFRDIAMKEGRKVNIVTQTAVGEHYRLQDRVFEKMYNFADPLAQVGKRTGKSVNADLIRMGPDILNDALDSINRGFESLNRRLRAVVFEGEIKYVNTMRNADIGVSAERVGQNKTIYDEYARVVYGNPSMTPKDNVGRLYQAAETVYDNWWRAIGEKYNAWAPRDVKHISGSEDIWKSKEYQDGVADYTPFTDVTKYIERTYKSAPPQTMKKHLAALNSITANLALRFFEVGHAVLNLTSLAATMPAVIKVLRKSPNETHEAWTARTNSFGIRFGEKDAMFSPIRALTSGVHFMFSEQGYKVYREAAKLGYFDQEVSEMMGTLIAPKQGYVENLLSNFGKKISFISDSSEKLARGIAFMTGANIAMKSAGFKNPENVYLFAHRFADDVIGDFRPNNRPRIFQGAMGMPIGLFQTFMTNYYQRMLNYVELGDKGALAVQFATQAAVFGAQSVPGFQIFSNTLASNYDGTSNPVDALTSAYGQEFAELFLYGSLANIPKMFGEDGVAIHTRGDVNLRNVPGLWSIDQTPVFSLAKDTFTAIAKTISSLRNGGADDQVVAEILGNYGLSRPLKNAAEIYSGYATDRRGQVISDDTRSAFSIATRIAGLKPLSEARAAETFYRMSGTEYAQRGRLAEFREQIRSRVRGGGLNSSDIESAVRNYLRYGGNAGSFGSWLTDQAQIAMTDKGHAELIKAIKDPTRGYDVRRLMSLYNLAPGDPEFQD